MEAQFLFLPLRARHRQAQSIPGSAPRFPLFDHEPSWCRSIVLWWMLLGIPLRFPRTRLGIPSGARLPIPSRIPSTCLAPKWPPQFEGHEKSFPAIAKDMEFPLQTTNALDFRMKSWERAGFHCSKPGSIDSPVVAFGRMMEWRNLSFSKSFFGFQNQRNNQLLPNSKECPRSKVGLKVSSKYPPPSTFWFFLSPVSAVSCSQVECFGLPFVVVGGAKPTARQTISDITLVEEVLPSCRISNQSERASSRRHLGTTSSFPMFRFVRSTAPTQPTEKGFCNSKRS